MKLLSRLLVGNLKRKNNAVTGGHLKHSKKADAATVAGRQAEGALKEPASEAQTKIPREN
ncbi:hypothetical protein NBRC116602_28050 [Hyphomicrobiales bacterium 4NK60-0047b]